MAIEPGTTPGTVPYGTGVTKGGDAYVNIPVSTVAGVNGLAPALSVDYSDGRGRQRAAEDAPGDLLGYGWRVGGFSAIRRCVRDTADGDGISLDGTDRLCIDGERLVLVGGDHLRPGAAYRTLRESYARIAVRGTAAAPWFEVQLPDGGVREYGRTDDARLDFATLVVDGHVAAEAPLLWSVNRETDAFGNTMTYEYVNAFASFSFGDATASSLLGRVYQVFLLHVNHAFKSNVHSLRQSHVNLVFPLGVPIAACAHRRCGRAPAGGEDARRTDVGGVHVGDADGGSMRMPGAKTANRGHSRGHRRRPRSLPNRLADTARMSRASRKESRPA